MTWMPVAQVFNSLLKRLESSTHVLKLGIRLLSALSVTVVHVEQRIIKATFKSCKLLARLLAYFPHVVACGTILHVVGAASVARSASPRHRGNTRVTKGDGLNGISTLSHPYNPIELEIQAGSKADRAHNTHTQSLWWIGSQVDSQMKRPNEKVMSKVVKLQRKSVKRYDKRWGKLSIHTRWKTNGVSTTEKNEHKMT